MRMIIASTAAILFVSIALPGPAAGGEAPDMAAAWQALPQYQYGQDMAPLLAIDEAVIRSCASAEARAELAAKLAAVLQSPGTTLPARQYICLKLRDVGTAAEVPVLAAMLRDPSASDMARWALEAIPERAACDALRAALSSLPNDLLVGVINSVGVRQDAQAVPKLKELAGSADARVQAAALNALGKIPVEEAADFLQRRAEAEKVPTPQQVAVPLLRSAALLASSGKVEKAREIYTRLSREGQSQGVRRAALEGLLRLEGEPSAATILAWFSGSDPQRRLLAASRLNRIPTAELEEMARQPATPESSRFVLLEILALRKSQNIRPLVMSLAQSSNPALRAFGIRALGSLGDSSAVAFLIDSLAAGGEAAEAAQQSLVRLPRKAVTPALLAALANRPEIRVPVIEVLQRIKCYEAIDPLIELAANEDPAVYGPAMDGLRGIADPDKTDLLRLIKLVARLPRGAQRDEAEKTVMLVCQKLPAGADRAAPVLALLERNQLGQRGEFLPLMGRLGGPKALSALQAGLSSSDPQVRDAAVRGLSNWPSAEVADQLLDIAAKSDNPAHRRAALRAYIRVVTLKSDRTAQETLALLEQALKLATQVEDQRLIIARVGTMRNRDAVLWLAKYLDDAHLSQAACSAILNAAYDRSLRSTHQAQIRPILEKIGRIATDPAIRERARQYEQGL